MPLPLLDAARIDDFRRVAATPPEQPAKQVAQPVVVSACHTVENGMVVSGQDVAARIQHRELFQLGVKLPGSGRGHRRVHHRRVAHAEIHPGRPGDGRQRSVARAWSAGHSWTPGLKQLRLQPPGQIDFGPGNVRMQVDPARHYHASGAIDCDISGRSRRLGPRNNPAILNPDIGDIAIDSVRRVMYPSANKPVPSLHQPLLHDVWISRSAVGLRRWISLRSLGTQDSYSTPYRKREIWRTSTRTNPGFSAVWCPL
jgi:hypothetical protein